MAWWVWVVFAPFGCALLWMVVMVYRDWSEMRYNARAAARFIREQDCGDGQDGEA
jgi:hypothetical protein